MGDSQLVTFSVEPAYSKLIAEHTSLSELATFKSCSKEACFLSSYNKCINYMYAIKCTCAAVTHRENPLILRCKGTEDTRYQKGLDLPPGALYLGAQRRRLIVDRHLFGTRESTNTG